MKKVMGLLAVVIVMAVMMSAKTSEKEVENELFLKNVEALAAGEFGDEICLGQGDVTCSTGEKVEYVLIPSSLK